MGLFRCVRFPRQTKEKKDKPIFVDPIRIDDLDFLEIVTERARQAAAWHVPAVFCPPVATFRTHKNAKTDNHLRRRRPLPSSAIRAHEARADA